MSADAQHRGPVRKSEVSHAARAPPLPPPQPASSASASASASSSSTAGPPLAAPAASPSAAAAAPPPLRMQALDTYACRAVALFEKLQRCGAGTYGTVYKARDKETGEIVALKKLRMSNDISKEGFPITSIREIKILKSINHVNIVRLKDVVVGSKPDSIFLAFEYCDHDLASLMDHMKRPFSESELKCLLLQLLRSVAHLHARFVLHRDLKLSNLLMTKGGVLKLADFGLARLFGYPLQTYTPKVVTLWYRAPEILLGVEKYHAAADCWAVGCIFGELLRHRPLLPGATELEQIEKIYALLGAPNDKIWPEYSKLPMVASLPFASKYKYNGLSSEFPSLSAAGMHLLKGLLCYDPAKRLTAQQALDHPYFFEKPLPKQPEMMPVFASLHTQVEPAASSSSSSATAGVKRKADAV